MSSTIPGASPVWPDDAPITLDEMQACAATLKKLYATDRRFDLFDSSSCRELRKSIGPYARKYQNILFEGKGRSEYEQKHFIKKQKLADAAQRKEFDKVHLNNTKLRMQRIEMLAALTRGDEEQEYSSNLPRALDGFVREDPTESLANQISTKSSSSPTDTLGTPNTLGTPGNSSDTVHLEEPRACYVCKARYNQLHEFYHSLCPSCSELNWSKRTQTCDLEGRVALVTGGRVKIGLCVALKLLRWGATVVVTTRFPVNCATRYSTEKDYEMWKDRFHVYGLDFRDLRSVEQFCDSFEMAHGGRLDILINNACQTIRRPTSYYAPLLSMETVEKSERKQIKQVLQANRTFVSKGGGGEEIERRRRLRERRERREEESSSSGLLLGAGVGDEKEEFVEEETAMASFSTTTTFEQPAAPSVMQSQVPVHSEDASIAIDSELLPSGASDTNGQQLDLRRRNTWVMKMEEIETVEVAEVFAINSIAPFILNSRLTPLMKRSPKINNKNKSGSSSSCSSGTSAATDRKFVVNVSAMEGKFYRCKSSYHPHTNMAKAALNMMTRTSSNDLSKHSIYMTAVDTGWINDENPVEKAALYAERHNFQTPLDEVDAAARILDPIVVGLKDLNSEPKHGIFIKDYFETEW